MTEAERAKLELERRKENKIRKARGEDKLTTVDWEMQQYKENDLKKIIRGESVPSPSPL